MMLTNYYPIILLLNTLNILQLSKLSDKTQNNSGHILAILYQNFKEIMVETLCFFSSNIIIANVFN